MFSENLNDFLLVNEYGNYKHSNFLDADFGSFQRFLKYCCFNCRKSPFELFPQTVLIYGHALRPPFHYLIQQWKIKH